MNKTSKQSCLNLSRSFYSDLGFAVGSTPGAISFVFYCFVICLCLSALRGVLNYSCILVVHTISRSIVCVMYC